MAISSRPSRRMVVREVEEVEVREPKAKPRRKGLRRFGIFVILLAALLWFLPMIAAKTPLLAWAVNRFGNLKGNVSIQTASLGWLSAPSISGIELRDEKNQPVIENLSVSGSNSLFGLIANSANLGKFTLDKPKLTLRLRPDGSNLEDLLANHLAGPSSSQKTGVEVDITNATIEIIDEAAKRTWQMDQVALNLKMPAGSADPITAKIAGRLLDAKRPGKLDANVSLAPSANDTTKTADNPSKSLSDLKLQTENFPLDILEPILARCKIEAHAAGWLTADLHTTLADKMAQGKTTVTGSATADDFAFSMPALGKDQIRLSTLRADAKGSLNADRLEIEQSSLACDLGSAQLTGTMQLKDGDGKSNLTTAGLLRQRCEMTGRVDLARLAAMLPNLLHVREKTQITAGEVQLSYTCRAQGLDPNGNHLAWQGTFQAVNLKATDNGRPIAWAKPIAGGFVAREEPQGIVVETVECNSDFLKISGSGTTDNLTASATFNLKQLAEQLGQFIELSSYQLTGEGKASATWRRDELGQFDAQSAIQLQNFQVMLSDQMPWQEPNMAVTLSAKGKTDFTLKNTAVDSAAVDLKAGDDAFTAQLRGPVKNLADGGVWPLRVTANGQLQNWLSRAAAFAPLTGYQAAGVGSLEAQLTASAASVEIDNAKIHADQFQFASSSMYLNEPLLDLTAAGSWNAKERQLKIKSALLSNSTLSVSAQQFVCSMPAAGPFELTGAVQYQSNLARLQQCFADRTQPAAWGLGGTMTGSAQFKQTGGVVHCETAAQINDFTVADTTGQRFLEPKIVLTAAADYDNKTKVVTIGKAELSSSTVAVGAVVGQVGVKEQTLADINGQVSYDWNRISELLRPYVDRGPAVANPMHPLGRHRVRFFGRNTGPVSWRGPLSLEKGQAAAELKWDQAYLYGFDIGPAAIKPKLENGVLAIEPMQVAVSQGKLFLAPKVRLAPGPMELTMPAGVLAQQVQITPDMCEMFLKYVAPVLADVSEARGAFSIELANCRLPLANPKQGDLLGKFIVHDIEIGPGPLIKELAILMRREAPAKLRKQSVVNFQMYQGRIYHDTMELIFPDFTIRTRGSVGIDDQTLRIDAELPVPPKWLENNPAAPALKNQTLALPIGGTLSRPQLDQAKMEAYTRQFIRKAAGNLLEEGLNRGLDQLFRQPAQ